MLCRVETFRNSPSVETLASCLPTPERHGRQVPGQPLYSNPGLPRTLPGQETSTSAGGQLLGPAGVRLWVPSKDRLHGSGVSCPGLCDRSLVGPHRDPAAKNVTGRLDFKAPRPGFQGPVPPLSVCRRSDDRGHPRSPPTGHTKMNLFF